MIYFKQIKIIFPFPCATKLKEDFRVDDLKKTLQSDFPHHDDFTTKFKCARVFHWMTSEFVFSSLFLYIVLILLYA